MALNSADGQALLQTGLKDHSTDQQIQRGTIHLVGRIQRKPVSIKITRSGIVTSNEFVVRRLNTASEAHMYHEGVLAARELISKRFGK